MVDISLCWVPIVKMLPCEHCRLILVVCKLEVALLFAMPITIESYYHSNHLYDHEYHFRWYNDRQCYAFLIAGASHVIVTSYVFQDGNIDFQRLSFLICVYECRFIRGVYFIQLHIYQYCLYRRHYRHYFYWYMHYHNLSLESLPLLDITYAYVHQIEAVE